MRRESTKSVAGTRTLCTVLVMFLVHLWAPSAGAQDGQESYADLEGLVAASDLIIRGEVISLRQGTRKSEVEVRAVEFFKGETNRQAILISYRGGKFLVDLEEPAFKSFDRAVLFLKKDGDRYVCVRGKHGKKTIRNDNIYLSDDNAFLNMKLKDYRKELIKVIRESGNEVSS